MLLLLSNLGLGLSLKCTTTLLSYPCIYSIWHRLLYHCHVFQAEMKCSTRFTCKSIISKSSRHFLFALTEDGLEIWTLSLACDCQGDIPVPALLHVQVLLFCFIYSGFVLNSPYLFFSSQDLTAAGCTPCPPIWLMLILVRS